MGTDYPQLERRERLLRGIHEWDQNRKDLKRPLSADQIVEMGGGEERALNLFLTLVHEQLIDADPPIGGSKTSSAPFDYAFVRGLHANGLRAIGELPNPQESFVAGIEAVIRAIKEDESISEPEKARKIDALEETKQIGRPLVTQFIWAMLKGDIPLTL